MIGCESEPLSLKSEYTLICKHTFNTLMMHVFALIAVVKLNASRKSKHKLIVEREQEIAVKDLLLGMNVLAILWEKLDFYIVLVGTRKYNENRIDTDGRIVFLATGFITGLLCLDLSATSLSELFKAFVTTRLR
jgi:hypothetical protein